MGSQPATVLADALRWLRCPVCHGELALHTPPNDAQNTMRAVTAQPASGKLATLEPAIHQFEVVCRACERRYPVHDGIPVLLPARALVDKKVL